LIEEGGAVGAADKKVESVRVMLVAPRGMHKSHRNLFLARTSSNAQEATKSMKFGQKFLTDRSQ